ncbi:MAG TPA: OmpA family protein [Roseomonas sp.]|nr:OmpA family protein [Roseomonas sp.]
MTKGSKVPGAQKRLVQVRDALHAEPQIGFRAALAAGCLALAIILPNSAGAILPARTYLVFFDRGSADLTDRAQRTIEEALQATRRQEWRGICLEGRTDISVPEGRAKALSKARARAAADHLVSLGVSPRDLTVIGFGHERPLVPHGTDPRMELVNNSVELRDCPIPQERAEARKQAEAAEAWEEAQRRIDGQATAVALYRAADRVMAATSCTAQPLERGLLRLDCISAEGHIPLVLAAARNRASGAVRIALHWHTDASQRGRQVAEAAAGALLAREQAEARASLIADFSRGPVVVPKTLQRRLKGYSHGEGLVIQTGNGIWHYLIFNADILP